MQARLTVGDQVGDFEIVAMSSSGPPRYIRSLTVRCVRCGCVKYGVRADNLRNGASPCRWEPGHPRAHRGRPPGQP